MKRHLLLLVALAQAADANPILLPAYGPAPGRPLPESVMISEIVTVTIGEAAVTVSGRYRFRDAPNTPSPPASYFQTVQLPVPIPPGVSSVEEVAKEVCPILLLRGAHYQPEMSIRYATGTAFPGGVRLALFGFRVPRSKREKEIEVEIRYSQPVASVSGADIIYYVPYLPYFQRFGEQMGLREDSFQIRFEAVGGVLLRRGSQEAKSFVLPARHKELIAVERKKPSPQRNAGIGPAISDEASPSHRASSFERTACAQSPRG